MQFTKIGTAQPHVSKKGTKSLKLELDPSAQQALLNHDWAKGIFIFRSGDYYTVSAPMPDNYQYKSIKEATHV